MDFVIFPQHLGNKREPRKINLLPRISRAEQVELVHELKNR